MASGQDIVSRDGEAINIPAHNAHAFASDLIDDDVREDSGTVESGVALDPTAVA